MSVGNSRRAWRSGDHARRRSAGGSITLIMGWLQCAGHAPVLCILQARGGSSPLAWETHAPHCSSHPLAPISPPAQTGGLRSGRGVTRLENGLPGAVVQAAFISACFFEFYLFRRLSSTIARTRAIFQPTRAILHPPGAGPWIGSANLGRHALKFEGFLLSPASGLSSFWMDHPMIASRSLAFVWGDGKVARVGWKIARVSSAISPHASAITPRSATFARHASATAPPSAIIERLEK